MARKRGTFRAGLDELERRVGAGALTGKYQVNQAYAAVQHVRRDYRHPRGGGPDYVSIPLRTRHRAWYRGLAQALLSGGAERAMAAAMEDLDRQVGVLAPVDLNNLRRSGAVVVTSAGRPVYRRAARVARLPERARRRR